jgi:hypothetical protein
VKKLALRTQDRYRSALDRFLDFCQAARISTIDLASAATQARWDALVRAAQLTLPVDLSAPGITALTRAVGSINSKNGVAVKVLRPGKAVDGKAVEEFVARVTRAPFKEVVTVLFGEQRISPCLSVRPTGAGWTSSTSSASATPVAR